ncbi:unnamed protein product [Adineta steineri]|uniref:Uncharacterized protein n=1 Tax=Adineta steineri TaxID=433720 RepID=A0A814KVS2_9BILA|nr:unnamed protein product [Adineta steineri]
MLVSPTTTDYGLSITRSSSVPQSVYARMRILNICEPSLPSRDVVRRENYARRKGQEFQGWACPRTIPYQDIEPVELSSKAPEPISNEPSIEITSIKSPSRTSNSGSISSRIKSGSVVQDEHMVQFEKNIRHLQTVQHQHMRKSSAILRNVQLGGGVKDIVEKYSRENSSRAQNADLNRSRGAISGEKEQNPIYDRLLDDFEDDDMDGSRLPTHPVKLCHSAPPLNHKNARQAILRPFTPRFNSLSARLRIQNKMPFRDALYRQLCCILWFLRAMSPSDTADMISGCWDIKQWLQSESNPNTQQNNQSVKKQQEPMKAYHPKISSFEGKITSMTSTPKDNIIASRPPSSIAFDNFRKQNSVQETNVSRIFDTSFDGSTTSNITSDTSERVVLPIHSIHSERDLNESISSKSNLEDTTETTNLDSIRPLTRANSIIPTSNTSRTSISSTMSREVDHRISVGLASILERQRSPDVLLKKWIKRHALTNNPNEPLPITERDKRLLRVGDKDDLNRIFGLENSTNTIKEQVRARQTLEAERKPVVNVKRRASASAKFTNAKEHAQILHQYKRDVNDFTEEQAIVLNNRLQQLDNGRLIYYQSKLNAMQQHMPKSTLISSLLNKIRFDESKKKINPVHLKYQPWYIDLLEMVEPDYSKDHLIKLLLKELKEYADPGNIPTVVRFKKVLHDLKAHEICHPDIMAAIEFTRVHIVKMTTEDFDSFFRKQFPHVTRYVTPTTEDKNSDQDETAFDI